MRSMKQHEYEDLVVLYFFALEWYEKAVIRRPMPKKFILQFRLARNHRNLSVKSWMEGRWRTCRWLALTGLRSAKTEKNLTHTMYLHSVGRNSAVFEGWWNVGKSPFSISLRCDFDITSAESTGRFKLELICFKTNIPLIVYRHRIDWTICREILCFADQIFLLQLKKPLKFVSTGSPC